MNKIIMCKKVNNNIFVSSLFQVYSEELETIAQTFADRCSFTHSNRTERNSLSQSFVQVGENIYFGAGIPVNLTDIIVNRFGFSEATHYNYESNSCNPGRVCGHYTQVMNSYNMLVCTCLPLFVSR